MLTGRIRIMYREPVVVADLPDYRKAEACSARMCSPDKPVEDILRLESQLRARIADTQASAGQPDIDIAPVLVVADGVGQEIVQQDIGEVGIDWQLQWI